MSLLEQRLESGLSLRSQGGALVAVFSMSFWNDCLLVRSEI